jgi:hypothetical protein
MAIRQRECLSITQRSISTLIKNQGIGGLYRKPQLFVDKGPAGMELAAQAHK